MHRLVLTRLRWTVGSQAQSARQDWLRGQHRLSSSTDSGALPGPSAAATGMDGAGKGRAAAPARPSASVMVLSATNSVLVLQRVQSSTSFPSAHVFPGGNVDEFHDGAVPGPQSAGRHRDGPAYRMAAVRECFEETGVLLARGGDGRLLGVAAPEREAARRRIHAGELPFGQWLASLGAVADTDNLVPFTRWITPAGAPKRFTTQMYLYTLPLSPAPHLEPSADKGIEHTSAMFAPARTLLDGAATGAMTLFPPQFYLLHLLDGFVGGDQQTGPLHRASQRRSLLAWLRRTPTAAGAHATTAIPWAEKVVCPVRLPLRRADGRVVLALDAAGPELEGQRRGGDWERVVLVDFAGGRPRRLEVVARGHVLGPGREGL